MLALSRFTRATQRRKHKHKRKKKEQFSFQVLAFMLALMLLSPRFTRASDCAYAYTCDVSVNQPLSLVYTYVASISISTNRSTRNTCKPVRRKHKALCLRLCLCLRRPGLHVRCNNASTREWNDFHSLELVLVLVSLRRTCKPGRRKHKNKRKERKLKNSDKLSAYILVRHVGIKSRAKRQSGRAIVPHFYASALAYVTLCLCLSHV